MCDGQDVIILYYFSTSTFFCHRSASFILDRVNNCPRIHPLLPGTRLFALFVAQHYLVGASLSSLPVAFVSPRTIIIIIAIN